MNARKAKAKQALLDDKRACSETHSHYIKEPKPNVSLS